MTTFGWIYQTLMPVVAKQLGVGSTGFGVMLGVVGAGALAGAMLVAWLGDFRRKGLLMLGAGFCFGFRLFRCPCCFAFVSVPEDEDTSMGVSSKPCSDKTRSTQAACCGVSGGTGDRSR